MNILKDIAAAGQVFGEIRKARKSGASSVSVKTQPKWTVPFVELPLWGFTWEACIFYGKVGASVRDLFDTFDEQTQRRFTFAPKDGEFVDRVLFWKEQLRPVLPLELYHEAMLALIRDSIRVAKLHKEAIV